MRCSWQIVHLKHSPAIAMEVVSVLERVLQMPRRYGNTARAWRVMTGGNAGTGKLCYMEWCNACRSVGYNGDVRKVWRELDDDESGIVSFAEFDEKVPPAARLLECSSRSARGSAEQSRNTV